MKIKISFEIDLSETPYDVKNKDDIPNTLQFLGSWLQELQTSQLTNKISLIKHLRELNCEEEYIQSISNWHDLKISISEQIFNNYSVEGIMEDKKDFIFCHQEPGYKESLVVNGKLVKY